MDIMPINFVILCSIPEAIMVIYLGLYLLGVKPPLNRVIIAGVLQGIATYFIRRYTGYGMSLILQTITCILLTYSVVKVNLLCSLTSNLVGIAINAVVEAAYLLVALKVSSFSFSEILSRNWLRVIFTIPRHLILLSIIIICVKYKFTLEEDFEFLKKINGQVKI